MDNVERVIAILLVLVRLFLVVTVAWLVIREIRKGGRARGKKT